jgi:hypothetical protein
MTADVAASVRARLLNEARKRKEDFERTLVRFAIERLLYRIGASSVRERCILKGASLLSFWLPDPYRATRDIDLLATGPSDEGSLRSLVTQVCAISCPEDGMRFDLSELAIETIRSEDENSGKRARFRAFLGAARIAMQIDFGIGDAVVGPIEEIDYPRILKALPSPRLRAYPMETSVAEKFEAMVKLGTPNSRMKDFHDVWALAGEFAFDAESLSRAIAACFEHRGMQWTPESTSVLTAGFFESPQLNLFWQHYLAAGSVLVLPPDEFRVIGERIIRFLGPVAASLASGQPFAGTWEAGGPWSSDTGAAIPRP